MIDNKPHIDMTDSTMVVHDVKKDYCEGWIVLQFDGIYNEEEALRVIRKSYPNVSRVTHVSHPYDSKSGYRQTGTVSFEEKA